MKLQFQFHSKIPTKDQIPANKVFTAIYPTAESSCLRYSIAGHLQDRDWDHDKEQDIWTATEESIFEGSTFVTDGPLIGSEEIAPRFGVYKKGEIRNGLEFTCSRSAETAAEENTRAQPVVLFPMIYSGDWEDRK
jgi:hypothetical protein